MLNPVSIVLGLIQIYIMLMFVWVLGSWFPQLRYQEWYRLLGSVVEPYINLFRGLNLQFGGMDLTPMVAFVALEVLASVLGAAMSGRIGW